MITEWYFCNCLGSTPRAVNAFLCALETLENSESDLQLRHLSIEELQRMDVWMQTYAFSWIFSIRHKFDNTLHLDEKVKKYFLGQVETMPEDVENEFYYLIDQVFSDTSLNHKLIGAIEACANVCQKLPDRYVTLSTPYLDLKDFLPETITLSVVADNCRNNQNFAADFSALLATDNSSFKQLLQNALEYKYGRLAFRLAIRVLTLVSSDYSRVDLLSLVWKFPTAPFEPDLLQSTAEILFYGDGTDTFASERTALQKIKEEIRNLSELRKLTQNRKFDSASVLRRLDLEAIDFRNRRLSIIFWHCVLWEISSRLDPVLTADFLSELWTFPRGRLREAITVQTRFDRANSSEWTEQLKALSSLQGQGAEVNWKRSQTTYLSRGFNWLFFTPWVKYQEWARNENPEFKNLRYPDALKPEVLIRLISAIHIATRLLVALPPDDPNRQNLASLIAHGASVLSNFQKWLNDFDKENKTKITPQLIKAITGFALFARRQTTMVGTGKLASIAPVEFVEIIRQSNRFEDERRIIFDEKQFTEKILPVVLFNWIQDAYPSIVFSGNSSRWLDSDLILEIFDYFSTVRKPTKSERLLPNLIVRFLSSEHYTPDSDLKWTSARDKQGEMEWRVPARQILLTERQLDWNDWLPDWYEPVDWAAAGYQLPTHLVRSIERVASLKNSSDVPVEVSDSWINELSNLLSGIDRVRELDRFIRLRLLELIDDPILKDSNEEQELIALMLLEYGSVYELKQLFDQILFPDKNSNKVSVARLTLQSTLLLAMNRELEAESVKFRQLRTAQDPRLTLIAYQKSKLIEETITRLVYSELVGENDSTRSNLRRELRRSRAGVIDARINSNIRSFEADVTSVNQKNIITIPATAPNIQEWSIQGIVNNPNSLKATVFFADFNLNEVDNLFENPNLANTYSDGKVHNVVANIVHITESEDADRYFFNCGLIQTLSKPLSKDRSRSLKIYDYVSLPIQQKINQTTGKPEWRIKDSYENQIRLLPGRFRPNDVKKLAIEESFRINSYSLQIKDRTKRIENIDRRIWSADVSRRFQSFDERQEYSVFARLNEEGKWTPLYLQLTDLLLSFSSLSATVLSFMGEMPGGFGEPAWRFSSRPGENYVIRQNQFVARDAEKLAKKISDLQKLDTPDGLLVNVEPVMIDDEIYLKLSNSHPVGDATKFCPQLETPFDERNIQWRILFKKDENPIAEKDEYDNSWYYHLEDNVANGYPRKIKVEWQRRHIPRQNEKTAEFIPSGWDFLAAKVRGEHPWQNEITLGGELLEDFVDRCLNLKKGDRLTLKQVIGKAVPGGDGFISCLTRENLPVNVQLESLSLAPIGSYDKPAIEELREAEVIDVWDRETFPLSVDYASIEPDVLTGDYCEGILIGVPDKSQGEVCKIAWITNDGIVKQENFRIENLNQLKKIRQGSKVIGRSERTGWRFEAVPPYIRVRALWTRETEDNDDELNYATPIFCDDGKKAIFKELTPGRFVLQTESEKTKSILLDGRSSIYNDGLDSSEKAENVARNTYQSFRAVLLIGDKLLFGDCSRNAPAGEVLINNVKTTLKDYPDGFHVLNRVFDLRKAKTIFRHREESYSQKSKKNYEEILLNYLQAPYDLTGILQKQNDKLGVLLVSKDDNLMVPTDTERTEWSSWVELSPEEGQYVVEGFYSDEAVFRLFENGEGRVLASFRRVPALTPEQFFISIGEKFNEPIPLVDRLFYVGPEEFNEFTSERYGELHFRFEMGYGKTLLVPNRQLRYNNGKFSAAQFILFHGDIITGITFLSSESVENKPGQSEEPSTFAECIININEVNLQFSLARTLFSQRARYKIIHLLHAITRGDRIEVKFVEGFDESHLSERLKSFDRVRANLTPTSQARLLERIPEAECLEEKEIVFLGRLDEERFKSSLGKELYFEHIRLSFMSSGDGPALQNDERVFLRATEIIELPNDLALSLAAPQYLDEADIGKDFNGKWKRVIILRQRFSVRENLLKRILKQKGDRGLANRLLLTRLWQDNGTIYTDIVNRAPARRVAALSGEIAKEGILLAAIAKVNQDNSLILELSPGIFVKIEAYQISSRPEDLQEGSIVKVENAQITELEKMQAGEYHYKFAVSNAAFSDARYIPYGLRPAVMLPQNIFLKETILDVENVEQDAFWQDKKNFTIGGLPNITALPGYFDYRTEKWHQPLASAFIKLMETPHPKLVGVGFDSENFRIKPLSEDAPVGALQLSENSFYIWFISIADSIKERLYWQDVTFGDESVKEVIERAESETWEYHDETTGYWSPDRTIPVSKLNTNNIWSGPLFFETSYDRTIKLRYSARNFLRFGFPVEELIRSLTKKQRFDGWYTVAGISEKGGLWLELAPGRITELPANLTVLRSKRKTPISLTDFHWWGIEAGDKVRLKKWAKNPFTIDQIELKDWMPGPRKAFGPKRAFLPVDSHDFPNGALVLGKGEFKLKIPVANPHTSCRSVLLTPDNALTNLSDPNKKDKRRPSMSDVVLLGLSSNSNPVVLGLNEFRPLPIADAEVWSRDPLARWIVTKSNDYMNLREFSFLLEKTGGSLPVTVEKIDEKTKTIFFSRRYQVAAATIPQGKFSMARVLGLLDKRTVLMRCGGGFIKMPVDQVVSGLSDESLLESAVEFLSASQVTIWIRSDENDNLSTGLGEETSREIMVEPIGYIDSASENELSGGLICRAVDSLQLYWLPRKYAAYGQIPLKQLHRLFNTKDSIKVRVLPRLHRSPQISVLDVQEIKREFDAMEIGKETAVRLLEPLEGSDDEYVVESLSSKVLMTLKKYGKEAIESDILAVEVITRNSGFSISLTVAPLGQRPYHLDLPNWVNRLPSFGNVRDEMSTYKQWRSDFTSLSEFLNIKLSETHDDNTINQILVCAYYSKNSFVEEFQLKVNVAREWIRRNSLKDEIFLPYGVIACLLLNKCANTKELEVAKYLETVHSENVRIFMNEWRDSASRLLQNLGKRALRSIHVEALSRELFFNKKSGDSNEVGLWRRLKKLTQHVQSPLSLESMNLISQFCYAVELRNESELKSISYGLAASLGRVEDIWFLRGGAIKYEILKTLMDVSKTLYSVQSNRVLWLQPFHVEKLTRLLVKIEINEIDITLLDLLPFQIEKKNYED